MEPPRGDEPLTYALRMHCSTGLSYGGTIKKHSYNTPQINEYSTASENVKCQKKHAVVISSFSK